MPNSTSAVLSPMISAIADGRNASRSMMPRLLTIYSSRARVGDTWRSECPATLQTRAAYSSANASAAAISIEVNRRSKLASSSGTDARIAASTSTTMSATISRTKREPAE